MGKSFKYKDFVNKLRFQVGGVCPEEFGEYGEKYIRGFVHAHSLKAGKALHDENSVNSEACEVITQSIAEWTFHKIIDLLNGEVPEVFHERIISKVNEAIYDYLVDENHQCPLTWETYNEPDILLTIESVVKDTYQDALRQLYSDKGICKDTYTWAMTQSHVDDEEPDTESSVAKEDKFILNSEPQIPYKELFLTAPFLFSVDIIGIVIAIVGIILASITTYFSVFPFIIALICFIFALCGRIIRNLYNMNYKQKCNLETEIENLEDAVNPNSMYQRLGVDVISMQVGLGLIYLADPEQKNKLLPAIAKLRKDLTDELGYIIPNIRVMDNSKLKSNECIISIRNTVRERFFVETSALEKEEVIIKHLRNTVIKHANDIISKTDILKLMEIVRTQDPTLVNDLIPELISAVDFRRIIVNFIREQVSIKDIILIFERLCDFARFNKEPNVLNERLRSELGAAICLSHSVLEKDANKPTLYALTLSNAYEKLLEKSVQYTEIGVMFMLKPAQVEKIIKAVEVALLATKKHSDNVVLLVSPRIRLPLFGLLSRHFENIKVLSFSELITDINVECIGEIK